MKVYILFCSVLCIGTSSHAMEIIKKVKRYTTNKKQKDTYKHPIITDFLVTQKLTNDELLPKDVTTQIRQLCVQIRINNFKNDFSHLYDAQPKNIDKYGEFYILSSKNYKRLLRLPTKFKEQIAQSSNNIIGVIQPNRHYSYMGLVIKLKSVIPENNKKKYSPKILFHQNGWCYCC